MTARTADSSRPNEPDRLPLHELLAAQNARWDRGDRVMIDGILIEQPDVADDPNRLLPLIVNEWMLCWEVGMHPNLAEYQSRFPQYAAELARHYDTQLAFEQVEGGTLSALGTTAHPSLGSDTPVLPGYRILNEVGRGGMGVVYRAEQLSLRRIVAVKFLASGRTARDAHVQRFVNEGQLLARLNHPNVVLVYEVGTVNRSPYIVMEYIAGVPLDRRSAGQQLPLAEVLRTVEVLARAVAYSHDQGILHRDLKPANVLVTTDGVPKLTDFGLAKELDEASGGGLTRTGDVMGTPSYMAPEQAAGRPAGIATDVYGLGAILFELLTGRPPFEGDSAMAVVKKVMESAVRSPRQWRPDVSRDLETVCLKCLEKDPAARYPTAAALAADLRSLQLGESITARPPGPVERAGRWCRRNRGVATAAAIVLATLAVASAVSLGFAIRSSQDADAARRSAAEANRQRNQAREERWRGLLNEVASVRRSQRSGERVDALSKLHTALDLARESGRTLSATDRIRFQTEAASAFALPDLVSAENWPVFNGRYYASWFNADLTRFARRTDSALEIVEPRGGELIDRIPLLAGAVYLCFLPGTDDLLSTHPVASFPHHSTLRRWYRKRDGTWSVRWRQTICGELCIRPDGKVFLANRVPDGPLVLFDAVTGKELSSCGPGRGSGMGHRSFHPTRPWVLFGREVRREVSLVLWDLDAGRQLWERPVTDDVNYAAWHPGGEQVAVSTEGRTVRVYDAERGAERFSLKGFTSGMVQVCYTPTGEYLLTHDWSKELRVWDGVTGQPLLMEPMVLRSQLHVSPSGTIVPEDVGTAFRPHHLLPRIARPLVGSTGQLEPFKTVLFSASRRWMACTHETSGEDECVVHETTSGRRLATLPHGLQPLWFEGDDALVTVDELNADRIDRWPIAGTPSVTCGPAVLLGRQRKFGATGTSSDRRVIAFAETIYRDGLRTPATKIPHGRADVRDAAVSPDGRWIVLGTHDIGPLDVYDLTTNQRVQELWPRGAQARFSPNGGTVAVLGDVCGRLYSVPDWKPVCELTGMQAAYSPDGRLLVVSAASRGYSPGTLELLEASTGRVVARLEHPTSGQVEPIGFATDPAKLILRVRATNSLDVWDLRETRNRLRAEYDLDWDWPEFPPPPPSVASDTPWTVVPRLILPQVDWKRVNDARDGIRKLLPIDKK